MPTQTETDVVRVIDVPLLTLTEDDVIRRHPETDEDVVWRPVTWEVGEKASLTYTTPGSEEHQVHEFDEAMPWVTVQAPAGDVVR